MKLLTITLVLLASIATACMTVSKPEPKREGNEVKCAPFINGPVTEVCIYPMGVLCFGGDKGISCLQPLPMAGRPT
jgi:hypothetical protein